MAAMKHTFVIPAYQESPYLETCIRHLIAQTVQSQIIITTSTPSLFIEEVAATYGLAYYINPQTPNGIAHDWNFALSKANTTLVTIAHQDDVYESTYVQTITEQFALPGSAGILIAFTGYRDIVNGQIKPSGLNAFIKHILLLPFIFSKQIGSNTIKKMLLLFGDPVCCPSVTFNMDALAGFSFSGDYECVLDWYAWYELAKRPGSFLYINKKLVRHRIHPQSETTNQLHSGQRKQEELRLFKLMWGKRIAPAIARIYTLGHKSNL